MFNYENTQEIQQNDRMPETPEALMDWVEDYTGVRIANQRVCLGHHSPGDYFAKITLDRPPLALALGPRGGGKSFLSALNTHFTSRWHAKHGTRILGGSLAQSAQVYRALRETVYEGKGRKGSDAHVIAKLLKGEAIYHNGSDVSILAASSTSVRGPHVASLKLDEVDEIAPDLREAAMGMCMNRNGSTASALMTSTWHRMNGPMAGLMDRAAAGEFPLYTFCAFDVLERCLDDRSGPKVGGEACYANCPQCPLKPWCHAERDRNGDVPLAKRSNGHYEIDSLIQKIRSVSVRTFESEYLCKGPKAEGRWFRKFDSSSHSHEGGEYNPTLPVHLAIDSGVFTGAVFFQVGVEQTPSGPVEEVRVFADYLAENLPAEQNARAILGLAGSLCEGRLSSIATDPSGGARNPVGPTVIGEYERVGLSPMLRWSNGSVSDSLALVESFLNPANGRSRLTIHPRCKATVQALQEYRRAKRAGQWQDYPEDPQHPYEDLVDALRGGLGRLFPEGRYSRSNSKLGRVHPRQVF
jgi:hypothetical protein